MGVDNFFVVGGGGGGGSFSPPPSLRLIAFLNYHAPVDGDPLVLSLIYDMYVEDIHYAHKGWGIISFNRCITDWLVNY